MRKPRTNSINVLLFGSVLCAASVISAMQAHAQGQITFAGAQVNLSTTGGRAFPSNGFDYGLYVGSSPASISSTPVYTLQGSAFPGMIGNTQTITSQPAGTAEYFQVKGWSASLMVTSWEAAQVAAADAGDTSALAGVSPVGFVTLTSGPVPAASIFGMVDIPGREINIPSTSLVLSPILLPSSTSSIHLGTVFVPEPASLALAGLGCVVAAFLHRRREF